MNAPLVWTREKPIEPGWYWYRSSYYPMTVVEVQRMVQSAWVRRDGRTIRLSRLTGEWSSSRIAPPIDAYVIKVGGK